MYYGARYYDPRTSVWQSPDPIMASYLDGESNGGVLNSFNLSLYTYTAQNPVLYVDPSGSDYTIYVRAFWHPNAFRSFGYKADGRSFSTDRNTTARAGQSFRVHFSRGVTFNKPKSSPTISSRSGNSKTASYTENENYRNNSKLDRGKSVKVTGWYKSSNPHFPTLKNSIAIWTTYSVALTFKWVNQSKTQGILEVSIEAKGKGFPDNESFIYDNNGVGIFLGTKKARGSSPIHLAKTSKPRTKLYNNTIEIETNKKGNFSGRVRAKDGKWQSIESWNKQHTSKYTKGKDFK